jgi:hypothetical protein
MGKEERIRAITTLYYSRPVIQQALVGFSHGREVVPRYFEGFGKRPDILQYPGDVMGLVHKGATSFHASEERWRNPLALSTDNTPAEVQENRGGWDLVLDIDSPFLDCSRIAAQLIIAALEHFGITRYGLKFSGSKGFHLIVPWEAFPHHFQGQETRLMFPEWPRAISSFLMHYIRSDYNTRAAEVLTNIGAIEERTKLTRADLLQVYCFSCSKPAQQGKSIHLRCPLCSLETIQRNPSSKEKRRCVTAYCPGFFEQSALTSYWFCQTCRDPDHPALPLDSLRHPDQFDKQERVSASKVAALDLVLVSARHLFRMPYSLHEKTCLVSCVLTKEELALFSPRDAQPLTIVPRPFLPLPEPGEAKALLTAALAWKREHELHETARAPSAIRPIGERTALTGVSEALFPPPIVTLLHGKLTDGKKRGLFILITFLRACGFSPDVITEKIIAWNKTHEHPLKTGYVMSQLTWHLRQKKLILPPNYTNTGFYGDLRLFTTLPRAKNPVAEVVQRLQNQR